MWIIVITIGIILYGVKGWYWGYEEVMPPITREDLPGYWLRRGMFLVGWPILKIIYWLADYP